MSGQSLTDCKDVNDTTCSGGVAATAAYSRYLTQDQPSLIIPHFDFESALVQLHPLKWDVNRLILNHLLGWKVFVAPTWFVGAEEAQQRDMAGLQTVDFPLLLSNVAVPSSNSWYHYTKGVYFDNDTGLAVMFIAANIDTSRLHWPDDQSVIAMLDYIARVNEKMDCVENVNSYDVYVNQTYVPPDERKCWIPVVMVDSKAQLSPLWQVLAEHVNPPAVVVDLGGRFSSEFTGDGSSQTGQVGLNNVWAVNYAGSDFKNIAIELDSDGKNIMSVFIESGDVNILPPEAKDEKYASDILALHNYSVQAVSADPIIGRSTLFPIAKAQTDEGWLFVQCEAGECLQGNLFNDAMRWGTNSDFSFTNSGGYHGPGWPEGEVRVSDLWNTLPFANTLCTGTMSGISVFKLFEFSTASATFEGKDTVDGGDLLQVSGVRVTYNTQLVTNRLVGLDIWNETRHEYLPVDRLKMYNFVSDSYNCLFNDPFNKLSGNMLSIPGEVPGKVGSQNVQEVVAKYLTNIEEIDGFYNGKVEGRLVNNTDVTIPMNLVQTEDGCSSDTYWVEEYQTCFVCPSINISNEYKITFDGVSQTSFVDNGEIIIKNDDAFPVKVYLKSVPPFIAYSGSINGFAQQGLAVIDVGGSLALEFSSSSKSLSAGTALGEVVIGVSDGGTFPGCLGNDIRLEVEVTVRPTDELNQLGSISIAGWTISAVLILATLLIGGWCLKNRKHSVIRKMQPPFLLTILFGVLVLVSVIIPLSIDDGVATTRGCDIACMATPWLLSLGLCLTLGALFSKLWRINRLFFSTHGRVTVKEKDVVLPAIILFTLNMVILLCWTTIDPLRWERVPVEGEPWNTHGICSSDNVAVGNGFWVTIAIINVGALLLSCWQAYKARNHSDEYSEANGIGIALYSWLQLAVIGIPVTLLIDETDTEARYFVLIGLISAISISLLISIFLPIWKNKNQYDSGTNRQTNVYISGVNASTHHRSQTGSNSNTQLKQSSSAVSGDLPVVEESVPATSKETLA